MKPVAYAYVRYSSVAQATGGSVERQVDALKAFTEQTGVEIKEIVQDNGVSSFKGRNVNRGQFKKILDRIDSGVIKKGDYIVVESIDRITRQRVLDGVALLQDILRSGIRIYTTSDRICYSRDNEADDLNTIIMIALIAKRANEESATKSWRRTISWDKAKKLAFEGVRKINIKNAPYGLMYDSSLGEFVLNESEAKEVRRIFELLKYMGVSKTVREMNKESKRRWAGRHVAHMIASQYPVGVLRSQKRDGEGRKEFVEYIEGYYPEIVSQTAFNEAVSAMKGRRDRKDYGSRSSDEINIFRGVVKCAKCGASLLFEKQKNQKGVPYFYLHCYSRKELKRGCDQRFRFDLAFGMFLMFVRLALSSNKPAEYVEKSSGDGGFFYKVSIGSPALINAKIGLLRNGVELSEEMDREKSNFDFALRETQGELVELFSSPTSGDIELENEFVKVKDELEKVQAKYGRLEKSIENSDGSVSKLMMKQIKEVEDRIDEKLTELEELGRKISDAKINIPIHGVQDVIDMFKVKAGRLDLNRFLVSKKIKFEFEYQGELRRLRMNVSRDGVTLLELPCQFPLHNPLKLFGLPNLAEFCDV
ncbi:recombinase family protein [Pseudomonas aeruginosa]|uniref:recombinase family protein n=1 Tax=Pseudomonas aeruginosa TaxID=287 RepID=UPI00071B4113|nr:recombinase family protein [Pseudomonas aeruginosa]KSR38311.1 recombinase family protein [Pseudomonas aeruginosa]MBG7444461.1 recombinase family protein [Pseudomonas aeruginosa]MDU0517837.1 recombinase family protein [Pseudomonas aeruginosa]RPV10305.1 recombinase family protein [Pseudomonas aeruginosa]